MLILLPSHDDILNDIGTLSGKIRGLSVQASYSPLTASDVRFTAALKGYHSKQRCITLTESSYHAGEWAMRSV